MRKTGNWLLENVDERSAVSVAQSLNISQRLAEILHRRGYSTPDQARAFLFPSISQINSPFLMKNMLEGVARLKKAVSCGEKIGIFSDSDLDGMTALTVFHHMLGKMGIETFYRFTKNSETYGLTHDIIDEFASNGVKLIVTADSGTRDIDEVEYAKSRGIDMIVTDHHEPDEKIPNAILINPKQKDCKYPFKDLCGASVIFKFCQAFLFSYLPAFNTSFALVSSSGSLTDVMIIRNGIVEEKGRGLKTSELGKWLGPPREDLTVIHSTPESDLSGIEHLFEGYRSFRYDDFMKTALSGLTKRISPFLAESSLNGVASLDTMYFSMIELFLMPSQKISDFISMAMGITAIGCIADVMPMVNENRALVKFGIDHLNQTKHPGILALVKNSMITSKTIAWEIAPLLNTPGRFGLTDLTGRFFLSDDIREIRQTISEIRILNEKRKEMVNTIYSREIDRLESDGVMTYRNITCVSSPDIPDGLAGLIALKISEKTEKPSIVISSGAPDGIYKGSGRSAKGIDFFSMVAPLSRNFERIGGHAQAFGFTIRRENTIRVMTELDALLDAFPEMDVTLHVDVELDFGEIHSEMLKELSMLAPYGKGNEEPVIMTRDVTISGFTRFGDGGIHGRFIFDDNPDLRVIGWRQADEMEAVFSSGKSIDIAYTVEEREFNGRSYIQLQLIDFALHE